MSKELDKGKVEGPSPNFIRNIIAEDLKTNKHGGKVVTRFPPEPNGYLHVGHAKSICLNFGIAAENNGICHLRFDDTNPSNEDIEFMDSMMRDIKWLGFDWKDKLFHASDYFDQLYDYAVHLIKSGKAYVCELNADDIRKYRGTLTDPGKNSPFRERSIEENLELFEKMRAGEFEEGKCVLRAKIDMSSPNISMRDPALYRIKHQEHHRTGAKWCIYPMYDFTHCISDSLEGITHSLCTLEFQDNRALYDWVLDNLPVDCHPQQIEFARFNLNFTVLSKRKLKRLVEENFVDGWNDPRMHTMVGLRRRGYTPKAIRNFYERIGVGKKESIIDMGMLEDSVREDLNEIAPRAMCVLNPLKITITNYDENKIEEIEAPNHPNNETMGKRKLPFSKHIYIEQEDFMENPPKKFFRLAPGREVRLKYAYYIKCETAIKDKQGNIIELQCTYDPETKGGSAPDGRKVKGTLHWVSEEKSLNAEVRMYDRLFNKANPNEGAEDFTAHLNPDSLKVLKNCKVELNLADAEPEKVYQFERQGYFCADSVDSRKDQLIFNRTVSLRDTWAKLSKA